MVGGIRREGERVARSNDLFGLVGCLVVVVVLGKGTVFSKPSQYIAHVEFFVGFGTRLDCFFRFLFGEST